MMQFFGFVLGFLTVMGVAFGIPFFIINADGAHPFTQLGRAKLAYAEERAWLIHSAEREVKWVVEGLSRTKERLAKRRKIPVREPKP